MEYRQFLEKAHSCYIHIFHILPGVFGGSNQIVQLYASGVLMGVPKVLVNPLTIRGEQRSSISNLYMLPAAKFFSPKTEVIARTKDRTYYVEDTDDFLRDIGFPEGAIMRKQIVNSTSLMGTIPGMCVCLTKYGHCYHFRTC